MLPQVVLFAVLSVAPPELVRFLAKRTDRMLVVDIRLFGVGLDAFYLVAGRSSSIFGTFGLGLSYSF